MAPPQLQHSGVSVFYPHVAQAATNLKNATLFTRINVIASPETVKTALESTPTLLNTFCLGHLNNVLVFDSDREQHVPHVCTLLNMMRDKGLKADIDLCAFDKPN
ncbi:MAG: hypothetical protein Q9218_002850 [Villophora microphyllina]